MCQRLVVLNNCCLFYRLLIDNDTSVFLPAVEVVMVEFSCVDAMNL